MSAQLFLTPRAAAELACHDEQLAVWARDLITRLASQGFVSAELTGPDIDDLHATARTELKRIIAQAFDHPECRTIRVKTR